MVWTRYNKLPSLDDKTKLYGLWWDVVGFNNILNEFNPLRLIALTTMEIWTEILSSSNVQERHLILLKIKANSSFHIFFRQICPHFYKDWIFSNSEDPYAGNSGSYAHLRMQSHTYILAFKDVNEEKLELETTMPLPCVIAYPTVLGTSTQFCCQKGFPVHNDHGLVRGP